MNGLMVVAGAVQMTSCVALVGASIHCWRRSAGKGTRGFLFPFVVAAGLAGLLNLYPLGMEVFMANYSGAMYEAEPVPAGAWIRAGVVALLQLLPLAGLIPWVGRRAMATMVIALVALAAGASSFV